MVNVIYTLSKGQDEIFRKDYVAKNQIDSRPSNPDKMIDNSDGFFSGVPQQLFTGQNAKGISLNPMTKEEKLQAKIKKSELKIAKEKERQEKLAKMVDTEQFKVRMQQNNRFNLADVRSELEANCERAAQAFITAELQRREAEWAQKYDQAIKEQ